MNRIGIVGGGAWGTALALVAHRAGCEVAIWCREAETAEAINASGENPNYLPGVKLDPAIAATTRLESLAGDLLMLAVPAQFLRAVAGALAPSLGSATPLVICAKGVERRSGALMTEVLAEIFTGPGPARPVAVLSGPTFAAEVADGKPTAVTLACADRGLGRAMAAALGTPAFRPYLSDDLIGAQIGGAVKNVLAIACGIVAGRGLGENARAALITRGLAEMSRLAVAMGGRAETMAGLSGVGDLVLTCAGPASRNMSLGVALGEGARLGDIMAARRAVTEGVYSADAVVDLAVRYGIEMPISAAVDAILHRGAEIDATIHALLARPFTDERDDE